MTKTFPILGSYGILIYMKNLTLLLIFACFASGCSTPGVESFSSVEKGMTKTQVLDELGSPFKSDRVEGTDVYIYRYFDNDRTVYREVQLKDSYVTYVGDTTGTRSELFPSTHRPSNTKGLEKALNKEKKKATFEDVE